MGNGNRFAKLKQPAQQQVNVAATSIGGEQSASGAYNNPSNLHQELAQMSSASPQRKSPGLAMQAPGADRKTPGYSSAGGCGAKFDFQQQKEPDFLDEDPRDSPSKITHGFWLQQYNWLHNSNQTGAVNMNVGGSSPAHRQPTTAKQKLLAKWNNLKRTFGGSSNEVVRLQTQASGFHSAPSTALSTLAKAGGTPTANRWAGSELAGSGADPTTSGPTSESRPTGGAQKASGRRHWFLKSVVSSSATSLLHPGTASGGQGRGKTPEIRSKSSCDQQRGAPNYQFNEVRLAVDNNNNGSGSFNRDARLTESASKFGENNDNQQASEQAAQSPSKRSSPYRQIARVLARTKMSPRRSRKRHKLTSKPTTETTTTFAKSTGAGADESSRKWAEVGRGGEPAQHDLIDNQRAMIRTEHEHEQSRRRQQLLGATKNVGDKENCDNRAKSSAQSTIGSGSSTAAGILGSIFVSPRLFGRPKKRPQHHQNPNENQNQRGEERVEVQSGVEEAESSLRVVVINRIGEIRATNDTHDRHDVGNLTSPEVDATLTRAELAAEISAGGPRGNKPQSSGGEFKFPYQRSELANVDGSWQEENYANERLDGNASSLQFMSSQQVARFGSKKNSVTGSSKVASVANNNNDDDDNNKLAMEEVETTLHCANNSDQPTSKQHSGQICKPTRGQVANANEDNESSKLEATFDVSERRGIVTSGKSLAAASSAVRDSSRQQQQRRQQQTIEPQDNAPAENIQPAATTQAGQTDTLATWLSTADYSGADSLMESSQSATVRQQADTTTTTSKLTSGGPDMSSSLGSVAPEQQGKQQQTSDQLLQLIQPLASSSSSFASSSICLDSVASATQPVLIAVESDAGAASDDGATNPKDLGAPKAPSVVRERPLSQPVSGKTSISSETPPSGGVAIIKDNFRKLVKRQQSVDSYRMARELKKKQKRQSESRQKHQSNEAIKQQLDGAKHSHSGRKFSMRADNHISRGGHKEASNIESVKVTGTQPLKICIDPYAEAGIFTLYDAGESSTKTSTKISSSIGANRKKSAAPSEESTGGDSSARRPSKSGGPTPPNTLSLMPSSMMGGTQHGGSSGGTSSFMMGTFSGCITPTYPTHHLPSPKYVSPSLINAKKYSNASTISSSLGADSSVLNGSRSNQLNGLTGNAPAAQDAAHSANISDSDSLVGGGGGSITPSRMGGAQIRNGSQASQLVVQHTGQLASGQANSHISLASKQQEDEAAAAARRANLAEHIYDNKCGLGEDMKFLASLPELCDITFLVGETREPVCAVKSVLAARSRVFHKILFGNRIRRIARQQHQEEDPIGTSQDSSDRRGLSPKLSGAGSGKSVPVAKPGSPMSRSNSPNSNQQPHWSVTSDATGYNTSPVPATSEMDSSQHNQSGVRSGRVSVASNGRESVGRMSQGSQQPLIIGPGQTATPAKRSKKSSLRDAAAAAIGAASQRGGDHHHAHGGHHHHHHTGSRLSRMFLKRASDPSIKQQHHHQHQSTLQHQQSICQSGVVVNGVGLNGQSYLDKMSSSQMSTTMIIEEFEPDVFRQLIEYIHTGCVLLQARTLLGLLNAADYYGLEQLRKACLRFVSCCITVDTVCSLLSTAERYIQYKCTKSIVQRVLEFVDTHANEIFKLNAFGLLPEHVVRLILARDGLQADEHVKYNGVYTWCEHYCRSYELTNIADVMQNFLDLINFHKIPTNVLLSEIYPTHIVPDTIFLSALAYQADPENFEAPPTRQRRMTLPNPMLHKDYGSDEDDELPVGSTESKCDVQFDVENQGAGMNSDMNVGASSAQEAGYNPRQSQRKNRRKSTNQSTAASGSTCGSQEQLIGAHVQTGAQHQAAKTSFSEIHYNTNKSDKQPSKSRKGSIAQVSISGVKRLSHKLSIRRSKAHSKQQSKTSVSKQQSLASTTSSRKSAGRNNSRTSAHSKVSTGNDQRDPLQVGQQILNAYLIAQKQRELEEQEKRRREEAERRKAADEAAAANSSKNKPQQIQAINSQSSADGAGSGSGNMSGQSSVGLSQSNLTGQQQQATSSSSRRKSFRDFRHISRKIFMRHSNSKLLQQSSSNSSQQGSSQDAGNPIFGTSPSTSRNVSSDSDKQQQQQQQQRRQMLKIKRSETVFESTQSPTTNASRQQSTGKTQSRVARLTHQLSSNFGTSSSSSFTNK